MFLFHISARAPPRGKYVPAVPPVAIVRNLCWEETVPTMASKQNSIAKIFFIENLLVKIGKEEIFLM